MKEIDILTIFSLLIHAYDKSLHLLRSLISFSNVAFIARSHIYFIKFIPKYFIFLNGLQEVTLYLILIICG